MGWAGTYHTQFFQEGLLFLHLMISFLHLEITLPFAFAKLFYVFEEKLFFTATIILSKGHSTLKINLKIS